MGPWITTNTADNPRHQELHYMNNPFYSNLWWHSFLKEEVAIHISEWSTNLSVPQRDGRSKDEIEQKKTDLLNSTQEKNTFESTLT